MTIFLKELYFVFLMEDVREFWEDFVCKIAAD